MAETATTRSAASLNSDPVLVTKKKRSNTNSRKPLAQKNAESVVIETQSSPAPKAVSKQTKASKQTNSLEKDLLEMQERFEKLRLEKERTEELLKEKDEILKSKDEEIEARGKKQEKLEAELNKLHKFKEFKPTLKLAIDHQSKDKEQVVKKKKGAAEAKRPSAPYILWCKDHWAEVKKANPDADFKETSTILGAKWKTVSAEEKKPYEEQYQAEKEAYLKIVAKEKREKAAMKLYEEENKQKTAMEFYEQYVQFLQEADNTGNKKAKKEKDPLKPKKPMLAYFIYSNERRPALVAQNKSFLEISKITGEEWKALSDKKKKPYEEVAKKNKEKYLQDMEEYTKKKAEDELNQKMEEEEMMKIHKQEALLLLKKKEKADNIIKKTKEDKQKKKQAKDGKVEVADPNKPKKPASSYILFSKETRKALQEERPGVNNATLNALISVKWKEISNEEKQKWNAQAAVAMDAYKKEMEEYKKNTSATSSAIEC